MQLQPIEVDTPAVWLLAFIFAVLVAASLPLFVSSHFYARDGCCLPIRDMDSLVQIFPRDQDFH